MTAAALVHPAIVLRRPKRRAHLAVGLPVALLTASGALGVYLYVPYRDRLRQSIFIHAPRVGLLFERKEHLAFAAFGLALAGALAYWAASRVREGGSQLALRKSAHWAFVASAALATIAAALGTVVASYKTF